MILTQCTSVLYLECHTPGHGHIIIFIAIAGIELYNVVYDILA